MVGFLFSTPPDSARLLPRSAPVQYVGVNKTKKT